MGNDVLSEPVLTAVMYDPDAPVGSRFRKLASTTIKRLYHNVAMLLPDGNVMVAGGDQVRFCSMITDITHFTIPLLGSSWLCLALQGDSYTKAFGGPWCGTRSVQLISYHAFERDFFTPRWGVQPTSSSPSQL